MEKPTLKPPVPTRAELNLPGEHVRLYACPVMPPKLHPDMDKVFAALLKRDPSGVIMLNDPGHNIARNYLMRRFAQSIPAEDMPRMLFQPFIEKSKFAHYLRMVDCLLDTFHYSFGSTAYMALGVGAPFVTLAGPYMSSRAGLRMYNLLGVPELIAATPEEYIELALKLAQDKAFYEDVAQRIAAKSDVFFNDTAIVDEFSDLLKKLYFG